jgi:pimeloyl-ACP methyl ester carboxylesterase
MMITTPLRQFPGPAIMRNAPHRGSRMRSAPPLWVLRTAFRTVGSVAPAVAARWAEAIFCRPPRHDPRPAEEAFLTTGTRSTLRSDNQDLAMWVWGQGPAVILAHGWGGRAGRFSALAGALLANGFRVVLFDAPAHGASMGRLASLPQFSRALQDVGDAVGPVYGLIGHSLGGSAVSLAMHRGLSAQRVVLLAPPADVFIFSHAFAQHLRIPPRARNVMQQNLEHRLQISWEELHIPTLARSMTVPVLIVHDLKDADVPYGHGKEIAHAWPGAELFTTTGLGHRAILRDREVVERVVDFLKVGAAG